MNFEFFRGDDICLPLTFKDGDTPIDIAGWTVYFTLKSKVDDSDDDAALKKDITTHTNPTQGETKITLTNTETDLLEGVYDYDIQYKDLTPEIHTIMRGVMNFIKDVTRRKA